MLAQFQETMRMIKIEHSIFALPFALVGAFWAAGGLPAGSVLLLILAAMVCARSAAMAFNRWLDADIDARNPRTATRSIPSGRLSSHYALMFTLICCGLFVLVAALLNSLALMLSPFFLLILLGYSYTKRFTPLCHLILGLSLGLAPVGAWIAVSGEWAWPPVLLGLAVMCWTAGFDIIYACQDMAFDRDHHLKSIPVVLGVNGALWFSRALHVIMLSLLLGLGFAQEVTWLYFVGVALVAGCLIFEQALVWDGNLDKVNMAFFTMNGVVGLVFGLTTILALYV